jgi:hypothetical protein
VIHDFSKVETVVGGKTSIKKLLQQDKGHRAEIAAFTKAIREGGPPPIAWSDLRAVSAAAILAVQSLREGVPFEIR